MSLDGNGTYSPPAPQVPAIPNTVIYADDFNQIILDIAIALSTAIFRDGQAAFTANQSMGGNKLTNLANGTNPQDAVTVLQAFTDPVFIATTAQGFKVSGSMFQALMTTINLVASGTLTLTGTTLLDASASGEVRLPWNTSVGTVSAAELGYLDGVTSGVQAQINDRAIRTGDTYSGGHNFISAVVRVLTQAQGDNSDKAANTAYVDQAVMNAAAGSLPTSPGILPGCLLNDGSNVRWFPVVSNPLFLNENCGGF